MGWSSGVRLFDEIVGAVLESGVSQEHADKIIKVMVESFEDADCDNLQESAYAESESVDRALRALHPDWYED